MYNVTVTIEVREQETYGTKAYAKSSRETLGTGDDLTTTLSDVSMEVLADAQGQIVTRKLAESAASK